MISEEIEKKLKPTLEQIIKTSDLDSLTLRVLRRKLEKEFNLEEKALDSHPYKDHIKEWTDEIINNIQSTGNDKEEEKESSKETSEKEKPVKAKSVRKTKAKSEEEEDFVEEDEVPKKKSLSLKRKRNVVDDEGEEDEYKEGDNDNDDDYKEEAKPAKRKRTVAKKEEKKTEESVTEDEKVEEVKESESEPEDLIEDLEENKPAPRSRKRSTKSKSTTKKTRTRTTKSKVASTNNVIKCGSEEIEVDEKDAATIEKLKKFVRECGCKKIWSKEFSGCTTANSIIKVLKNMLRELGIEGKPSLAKCKEIATRRELLKDCEELTTNVIYDRRAKRTRNFYADNTKTVKNKIEDNDDDENDEEINNIDNDDAKDGDFMDLSKYGEPEDSDDE